MEQQQPLSHRARAIGAYVATGTAARVEGVQAGGLVVVLLDELLDCLDALGGALAYEQVVRRNRERGRIDAILLSLEVTLNADAGDLSLRLGSIYRTVRGMVALGVAQNDPDRCKQARGLIEPIAEAWRTVTQMG